MAQTTLQTNNAGCVQLKNLLNHEPQALLYHDRPCGALLSDRITRAVASRVAGQGTGRRIVNLSDPIDHLGIYYDIHDSPSPPSGLPISPTFSAPHTQHFSLVNIG